VAEHQLDVLRLGNMASEIYKQISVISRASQKFQDKLEHCDVDINIARGVIHESSQLIKLLQYQLHYSEMENHIDRNNELIHGRNKKYGGYFAFSPLDRVLY